MLARILKEEESFAKQKSRVLHITLGDANSCFFYNAIAVRNSRNGIHSIVSPQGRLDSNKEIAEAAIDYFSDSVNKRNCLVLPRNIHFQFRLSNVEKDLLEADYTTSEDR